MSMQDDSSYHGGSGYVYTATHSFTLAEIWDGVDALERRGMPLQRIADALTENWEAAVTVLAKLGWRS